MESLSAWFHAQLTSSAEAFAWAIEQVPEERRTLHPPHKAEDWPAIRHIFHMLYYEERIALPCMRHWLGEPFLLLAEEDEAKVEEQYNEDRDWQPERDLQDVLAEFRRVRAEEVALLERIDAETWKRTIQTSFWGEVSLRWVVTKTLQHTFEHTHDLLANALFWKFWEMRAEQESANHE